MRKSNSRGVSICITPSWILRTQRYDALFSCLKQSCSKALKRCCAVISVSVTRELSCNISLICRISFVRLLKPLKPYGLLIAHPQSRATIRINDNISGRYTPYMYIYMRITSVYESFFAEKRDQLLGFVFADEIYIMRARKNTIEKL